MVPQHAHATPRPQSSRFAFPSPDPVRIAGISGTLVLNVVALALLLIPVGQAVMAPADGPPVPIRWIEDAPEPPPPPPPVEVEVVQPRTAAPVQPQPVTTPRPDPVAIEPAPIAIGELPATPVPTADPGMQAGAGYEQGPLQAGMRLEYARATPPPYPGAAIRGNLEGTVMLEVLVDVDGRPIDVRIHASSGHRVLDAAARSHVLREWSFRPAMRDGQPVQAIGIIPIDFRLDRG